MLSKSTKFIVWVSVTWLRKRRNGWHCELALVFFIPQFLDGCLSHLQPWFFLRIFAPLLCELAPLAIRMKNFGGIVCGTIVSEVVIMFAFFPGTFRRSLEPNVFLILWVVLFQASKLAKST
jgi:hypothetical protein